MNIFNKKFRPYRLIICLILWLITAILFSYYQTFTWFIGGLIFWSILCYDLVFREFRK